MGRAVATTARPQQETPREMAPDPTRDPDRRPGAGPAGRAPSHGIGRWVPWIVLGALAVALAVATLFDGDDDGGRAIDYGQFLQLVAADDVDSVSIDASSGSIDGVFENRRRFTTQGPQDQIPDADIALLDAHGVERSYEAKSSNWFWPLLIYGGPILLFLGFWIWMSRRAQNQVGGVMSIGRSRAKVHSTEKPSTRFADVAGYDGVKEEIAEVVDFLRAPARFKELGAKIPKGVLLLGPPGTGKTMLARAVAGEAGVPFISVTGSDFMEMFVGVGASRVRDLFETARKESPAIIFIDEIDSIGRKRGAGLGGGHDEREQTLNQMLAEMDGFETIEGVVVMAATNRPDILDPALLRPGRFDRQITVPLPTLDERRAILVVHAKDKHLAPDVDLDRLARGTPGMSGAELANLVNEAALFAARRAAPEIADVDVESARDRVLMGARRTSMVLSEEEKEIVAYHEAGHAVTAYVLEHADPVHKVTIIPTGMALGVTQMLPEEDRRLHSQEYILDVLAVRLGGRLAEETVFGSISTGAQDDLVGATELARRMVREWGMSERLGPMAWGTKGAVFLGDDLMHTRDYSDETARVIDEEVERILRAQEERTREILLTHRTGLDALAKALVAGETVDGAEVGRLVDEAAGYRVGGPRRRLRPLPAPPPLTKGGPPTPGGVEPEAVASTGSALLGVVPPLEPPAAPA
jgi:cell division protease FtsH